MFKVIGNSKVLLSLMLAGLMIKPVHAEQSWRPVLQKPADGKSYRSPTEPFIFPVPPDLPVEYLQKISLELDDVDVTSFVQRKDASATYTPVQPLTYGKHHMRIVYYATDGDIEELGNWTFQVRQSRFYRQAAMNGNAQLSLSQRVADKNIDSSYKKTIVMGAASVATAVADGNWQVSGQMGVSGNNNSQLDGQTRSFDVTNFLVTGQNTNLTVNVGNHSVGGQNLALGSLATRGISATLADDSRHYGITAFAMRPTPLNGTEGGLGVSDADNRIDGMSVSAFPFKNHPEDLFLSLSYLTGKSATGQNGAAMIGDSTAIDGDAWGLVSESNLHNKQVRLRFEYDSASLHSDANQPGVSLPKLNDDAYSVLAEYNNLPDAASGSTPLTWKVGLLDQRVGRDFVSIANTGLPRDKNLIRLSGSATKGSISSTASISSEYTNVNGDANFARLKTERTDLSLGYNSQLSYNDKGQPIYGILGQQTYSLMFSNVSNNTQDIAATSFDSRQDNTLSTATLSGSFSYAFGSFMLTHTVGHTNDNTHAVQNTDSVSNAINASLTIHSVSIIPAWQSDTITTGGMDTKNIRQSLEINTALLNNKLVLQAKYNDDQSTDPTNNIDTDTKTTTAGIQWRVQEPKKYKTGVALSLTATKGVKNDRIASFNNTDVFQAYFNIALTQPFGF